MGRFRVVGVNFDHMHMGDNLRMAHEHPDASIVGICDEEPQRMASAIRNFGIPEEAVFGDYRKCLETTRPDLVLLCPRTADHAVWVERVAPFGAHLIMEKPFAANLDQADRMIAAMQASGRLLAINWPLAWYPPHVTAKRLIDEGRIGELMSVNYYDGNRGPLYHVEDKIETDAGFRSKQKMSSWFYQSAAGGGSLLDYLGYGATLATWFFGGRIPLEVTSVMDQPEGLEVDEHSITVARYSSGLCRFETRWGTFTDPWIHQPQPKCGFEICGTDGTITSYDYESSVRIQTSDHPQGEVLPVDLLEPPFQNPVQYLLHLLETGEAISGPLAPETARIGQRIVDSALLSARERRTVPLLP